MEKKLVLDISKTKGFYDGALYEEVKKDYNSRYYDTLKFAKVEEVPSAEVVEQLKSLSDNDIERYADALSKLEEAVSIGYHEDMERMNAVEEQKRKDEEFIKNFSKKFGK